MEKHSRNIIPTCFEENLKKNEKSEVLNHKVVFRLTEFILKALTTHNDLITPPISNRDVTVANNFQRYYDSLNNYALFQHKYSRT